MGGTKCFCRSWGVAPYILSHFTAIIIHIIVNSLVIFPHAPSLPYSLLPSFPHSLPHISSPYSALDARAQAIKLSMLRNHSGSDGQRVACDHFKLRMFNSLMDSRGIWALVQNASTACTGACTLHICLFVYSVLFWFGSASTVLQGR